MVPGAPRRRAWFGLPLSRPLVLLVLLVLLIGLGRASAADHLAYTVALAPSGDAALDTALADASSLRALKDTAPVGPFALLTRARADADRLATALQSYGYYGGQIGITIAGRRLDDPGLLGVLAGLPAGAAVPVKIDPVPGTLFRLRHISLEGAADAQMRARLGLVPGTPARAADILAARTRLLDSLRADGHAFAKVSPPDAVVYPDQRALDVSFHVEPGPRVDLGPIRLEGLDRVSPAYVRERLQVHAGEPFDPGAIERARQDLAGLGLFSSVDAHTADAVGADGRLPLTFAFQEGPRHAVTFGADYSTDLGAALSASWTDRNLFGSGERLTLSAAGTELAGSDARVPGYLVGATLTLPDWQRRDQTLQFGVTAEQLYLYTYNQTATIANAILTRQLSPILSASIGAQGEVERIVQEHATSIYTLLSVPGTLKLDTSNDLLEPTRGLRGLLSLTPTESLGGTAGNSVFLIAQAQGSTYVDLSGNGRTVLAARALIGEAIGAGQFQLPADQRFYAGGSPTVRGYRYQYAGPQFPDGIPQGGTALDAASLELRQRIGASYGAVVFIDTAQVASGGQAFSGTVFTGVGLGGRYFTSFGPIRVDVGVPLTALRGNYPIAVYLGLGEAF